MTWARFDDRYDDGAKVRRAWHAHPRAVGLHAMAITYCARNETDGRVDELWLVEKLPVKRERDQVLEVLVDAGLFERVDGGYFVHDYLEYNDSHATLVERRRKDADRKSRKHPRGRPATAQPESERSPNGIHTESERNPGGSRAGGSAGAGPRPDPTPTTTPQSPPEGGTDRRPAVTYQRRTVPDATLALAAELVAEFDRQAGTDTRLYDGLDKPTELFRLVIGAVMRFPDRITAATGPDLIRAALADPWWQGPATLNVVFGAQVVERNLQRLASQTRTSKPSAKFLGLGAGA